MSLHVTNPIYNQIQTMLPNVTFQDGCNENNVIFKKGGQESSDDDESLASSEVEVISRQIKQTISILLFIIGAPGNLINMAVFYKQGLKDRVNLCLFALSMTDEVHLLMEMIHHGEQLHLQLTTKESHGPIDTFLSNTNLLGLMGCNYVSYILSAIIACERCLCVLNPLKFQTLLRTRTMALAIATTVILVVGLYFIMATRYRIGCVYDPLSGAVVKTGITGEFYDANKEIIDNMESFVFGVGLPVVVTIVVITATKLTIARLREVATWRAETSSSISPREVALTKMLVGNSILFLVCLCPVALIRVVWLVLPGMNMGHENSNLFKTTLWISEAFTFVNASLNIFVYYIMGSRYRETFWAMFGRKVQTEKE